MARTAELTQLMNSLQRVVAVAPSDPRWRSTLGERLSTLRRAFAEHVGSTEGPDGLYGQLLHDAPRLASGVDGLVREHEALLRALEGLYARVATTQAEPPGGGSGLVDEPAAGCPEEIRGWASEILRELYAHRQRGADLVYEAYGTDLGGET